MTRSFKIKNAIFSVLLIAGSQTLFLACQQDENGLLTGDLALNSTPTPTPTQDSPLSGTWMTDCLDLGGGQVNRIYSQANPAGQSLQAVLTYENIGCTGNYSLTDTQGNPIDQPTHQFDGQTQMVSGIPDGFYVLKITPVDSSAELFIIIYRTENAFHELVQYNNGHTLWEDWLLEPNVAGFVADPTHYVPVGNEYVIHFFTSEAI